MKKQQGFTLIELIMVIVILGILSAFALPRFANLSGQAEEAVLEGVRASAQSASAITHASWLASGSPVPGTVTLEGQIITIVNGYPAADAEAAGTICDAINIDGDVSCDEGSAGSNVATFTSGSCTFTYTEAPRQNLSPNISAIAVPSDGC